MYAYHYHESESFPLKSISPDKSTDRALLLVKIIIEGSFDISDETGNKTSELLTVGSESGQKWQALRPSTAESHPSTAK